MDKKDYISNIFRKILKEDLEEKAELLINKLDLNKKTNLYGDNEFDYVEENKSMCESCGGMVNEGENCEECGNMYEIDLQELGGMDDGHPRFGKTKFKNQMTKDEVERLLRGDDDEDEDDYRDLSMYNPYYGDDENMDDSYTDKKSIRTSRRDHKGDMGEGVNFEIDEEQLYEIDFEKEENNEGNAFSGALNKARKSGEDDFEVDGKKFKVKESILYTESDLLDLIENLVIEEKDTFKKSEPKGYKEYERVHNADKKENDNYLKSVAKKMTDYLKGSSDSGSKYEMKETEKFPTENGGMKKGIRKKYTPSDAVDEYIESFSYPGQTNLVYDEIKPNDEKIKGQLVGSSTNGNAQVDKDGKALGNVVPSEVGERFYKNFKDNLYGQEQMNASYKRQPQPVDQAGEETERGTLKSKRGKKTAQSVLNKLEESKNIKQENQLNEEFGRMQQLMGYNRKTQ